MIGSVLRIDRKSKETQILMICHTRELCNQIYDVYSRLIKGLDITISNLAKDEKPDS